MARRKYSDEFKSEAVKLAQRSDCPISETARGLGMNAELLRRWVKGFGVRSDGSGGISPEEHSENIRLRRELNRVTEERDILKKAVGIRYHLYLDIRRVALPGHSDRSVLQEGSRPEHERKSEGPDRGGCAGDGDPGEESRAWTRASLGQRSAVRVYRVSEGDRTRRDAPVHEPEGRLLGQLGSGELLLHLFGNGDQVNLGPATSGTGNKFNALFSETQGSENFFRHNYFFHRVTG